MVRRVADDSGYGKLQHLSDEFLAENEALFRTELKRIETFLLNNGYKFLSFEPDLGSEELRSW